MAKSANKDVRQLCVELTNAEADQDYKTLLELSNKLIKLEPKEVSAYRCKLIALIRLCQFDDALKIINEVPEDKLGDTTIEKSYILYRQNKNDEAFAELNKANEEDPAVLELKAQLYYRLERFQEAYDTYRQLCRDLGDDDFDDLRRANLLAATAKLEESGVHQEPTTSELETYEQLYNQACHLVACKKYEESLKFLELATERCTESLKADGFSEKEINDELKPIKSQTKFVRHRLSRGDSVKIAERKLQKRKKKARLPKNYDPNVQPDPERWLPKQERSAYKKKVNKKFKDRNIGRGTQGAASASSKKIDYSETPPKEATQSPKVDPPSASADGPRQQTGAQRKQQQKKKKKGGRW